MIFFPHIFYFLIILYQLLQSICPEEKILNNIIKFGEDKFRFLTFASYSNGDMVFETTAYPESYRRLFFGIKSNGRPFFNNGNYFFSIEAKDNQKFESDAIVIKLSGTGASKKEYFLSIGNKGSNAEIYDFDNNSIIKKLIANFAGFNYVSSFRNLAIPFLTSNNDTYYLFGFTATQQPEISYKFTFQKHKFNFAQINYFQNTETLINKREIDFPFCEKTGASCFQTENKIIVCFYLNSNEYNIIRYDEDLSQIQDINKFENNNNAQNQNPYYKCIHLKEEIGIFSFYSKINSTYYPILLFKKISRNKIDNYTIPEIKLLQYIFDTDLLLNDIIKLKDDKICFSSVNKGKDSIYITTIFLFENKYRIRYYSINLLNENGLSVFKEIRIYNYNNFISFAFSYCNNEDECSNELKEHFSALLFFSYPNSTDINFDLSYFYDNNFKIDDFSINLANYVKIENNIFGLIFYGIKIIHIQNCENPHLISSLSNEIINSNYTLNKNEEIRLRFSENNFNNSFNCNIEYSYIITEPNLSIFDSYAKSIGENDENFFQQNLYNGKYSYFNIFLDKDLITTNCGDNNCFLCLNNNNSFCIKCKSNFVFDSNNKICVNKMGTETVNYNIEEEKEEEKVEEKDEEKIEEKVEEKKEEEEKEKEEEEKKEKYNNKEEFLEEENSNIEENNKSEETHNIYYYYFLDKEKIYLDKNKDEIIGELDIIMDSINIGKYYEIIGNDFVMVIKPTNISSPLSSTHANFNSCENTIRNEYNISNYSYITFLQMEINNTIDQYLVNQVEYQAYDDKRNLINLSVCNNLEIIYSVKNNSQLNLSLVKSFKDLNIDILNFKDNFFTDICTSFSNSNGDIILEDRIIDFYQNYSLCENDCTYNEINIELMIISCNCSVKTNISTEEPVLKLNDLKDIEKSLAFEIIKCYNLVFSLKNKNKNIGFWIFCFLTLIHIPLYISYFCKGIKPIKDYIFKEMKNNGYITHQNIKKSIENNNSSKKKNKKKNKGKKKEKNPPKKKQLKYFIKNVKKKSISSEEFNEILNVSSSLNKIKSLKKEKKLIIHNNKKVKTNINNKKNRKLSKKKINISSLKSIKKNLSNKKSQKSLNLIPTQGSNKEENEKEKNNIINLNLINFNLNHIEKQNKHIISSSDYLLNIYTFKEAIKQDLRSICKIFYIYLLTKQAFFYAFFYRSPLVLFPLRLCVLLFIISSDLAFNALFYFDDKISEKYRYTKGLFLFALSKNITVILLSTLIGFVLLTLFTKLNNSINNIKNIFRKEEEKMKKNKEYFVDNKRKKEIIEEINNILKKHKIKVVCFIIIEFILLLFFWYYVTVFCHVYNKTQKSWLLDSILAMLSRVIIDFLFCLGFAKLYRISVESNCQCLYNISLFFYSFC